jgi:hypothetical protein
VSCNGWERAVITLPSTSVPALRAALNAHVNALHARALADARNFWTKHAKSTRSTKLYNERLKLYIESLYGTTSMDRFGYYARPASAYSQSQISHLSYALGDVAAHPHQLTVAELSKYFPKATNRTISWNVSWESTISLKGRVVTWDVPENNHAVENAHEEPLAQVFFGFLGKVVWTRGTGGIGSGNDEYRRESTESGAGSNYTTFQYGPLGEREFTFANGWSRKTGKVVRRRF